MNIKARRILIVHTDNLIKEILLLCLETIPHCKAIAVNSGIEGIEKAQSVDAVLIDVDETIPDLSWQELVENLQQSPLTNSIPLILLTANPQSQEIIQFQKQGDIRTIVWSFDLLTTADRVAISLNWQ